MNFEILDRISQDEVTSLFASVFSSSEGEKEGALIGGLASALAARIDNQEVICMGAFAKGDLTGLIFFTRLRFDDPIYAYLLSPVAVSTSHQRKGIGQALIRFGLEVLKNRAVELVVTYGDPAFYAKVGFRALSEEVIRAPQPLSMPEGWLGQSLSGEDIPIQKCRPACVQEFADSAFW
ncbi:GNAT family N-acetyltransferase [Hydrogenophaga sp.]|uniref:GNAT family N-acetyltransferase n=1 Tax=Hydrogenophaga sp. TaxID=1904254 RepID=UPI0025B909E9|nr:N-acetyltransferase [Hydrogenophaga sp.]MDO9131548.1 N-acetyltransferase [Hydrogenophaga sp.]